VLKQQHKALFRCKCVPVYYWLKQMKVLQSVKQATLNNDC
jgi:hypothetical protein